MPSAVKAAHYSTVSPAAKGRAFWIANLAKSGSHKLRSIFIAQRVFRAIAACVQMTLGTNMQACVQRQFRMGLEQLCFAQAADFAARFLEDHRHLITRTDAVVDIDLKGWFDS